MNTAAMIASNVSMFLPRRRSESATTPSSNAPMLRAIAMTSNCVTRLVRSNPSTSFSQALQRIDDNVRRLWRERLDWIVLVMLAPMSTGPSASETSTHGSIVTAIKPQPDTFRHLKYRRPHAGLATRDGHLDSKGLLSDLAVESLSDLRVNGAFFHTAAPSR